MQTVLSITDATDDHVVIEGYAIRWDATDLEGERFLKSTDLDLELVPEKPIYFDHGLPEDAFPFASGMTVPSLETPIGHAILERVDEVGVWVRAQLARANQYADGIRYLIEQGALGFSAGSAGHLVKTAANGDILRFPVVEYSLTPIPAQPLNRATDWVKTLSAAFTPATPKDLRESVTLERGVTAVVPTESSYSQQENENMSVNRTPENVQQDLDTAIKAQLGDLDARIEQAVTKSFEQVPVNHSGALLLQTRDPLAHPAVKAFQQYVRTGAKATMNEATDSEGGFLVPEQLNDSIVTPLHAMSILRQAGARQLNAAGTDTLNVPSLAYGGTATLTGESASSAQGEPTLGELVFNPYKYTMLSKVTEELLADSQFDVFTQVLAPNAAQAFATAENNAFTVGSGSSQPEGIVTGGTVAVTAAATDAVTSDELIDLYHGLNHLYRQNAVWMMSDDTVSAIRKLKTTDGQYLWQPGLHADQPDRLLGRPVVTNNFMASMATGAKAIVLGDFSYYWIVTWSNVVVKRLDELYAETGEVGFRWHHRIDGKVVLPEAIQILEMG